MSEYIVDTFGMVHDFANLHGDRNTPLYEAIMNVIASRQREEIVRCRDCKYYGCYDGSTWCSRTYERVSRSYFYEGETYDYQTVEPDGFCAWGEREEAE